MDTKCIPPPRLEDTKRSMSSMLTRLNSFSNQCQPETSFALTGDARTRMESKIGSNIPSRIFEQWTTLISVLLMLVALPDFSLPSPLSANGSRITAFESFVSLCLHFTSWISGSPTLDQIEEYMRTAVKKAVNFHDNFKKKGTQFRWSLSVGHFSSLSNPAAKSLVLWDASTNEEAWSLGTSELLTMLNLDFTLQPQARAPIEAMLLDCVKETTRIDTLNWVRSQSRVSEIRMLPQSHLPSSHATKPRIDGGKDHLISQKKKTTRSRDRLPLGEVQGDQIAQGDGDAPEASTPARTLDELHTALKSLHLHKPRVLDLDWLKKQSRSNLNSIAKFMHISCIGRNREAVASRIWDSLDI
ncbi:hypothetical protein T439DRAFT_330530 [Meredithblackwellia eburnea MCA 4105]